MKTAKAGTGFPAMGGFVRRSLPGALIVAGIVFVLAVANLAIAHDGTISASAWLPNALGVAFLLRARLSHGHAFLLVFAAANLGAQLVFGISLGIALIQVIGNTLMVAAVTWLTRRGCGGRPDMSRLGHLAHFVWAGGLIGPGLSAVIALTATYLDGEPIGNGIILSFASDAIGMVVLVPTVLLASDALNWRIARSPVGIQAIGPPSAEFSRRGIAQYAGVLAAGMACALVVFDQPNYPLLFLVPPVTLLHAFRLGALGSALYVLAVAGVACAMTVAGKGPIFAATPSLSAQGHLLQAFIVANFLTGLPVAAILADRDRIMIELAAGKDRLDLLAQNIADAILRYDLDGICTYASPSVGDVFDTPPEDLVGQPVTAGLHEDARDQVVLALDRLMQGQSERERITYRRQRDCADGSPVYLEADCAIAVCPVDGQCKGLVVAARDVSERVKLETLLTRARHKAENAARAKSEFLANMSHEFRTPMNGVLGFAELMLQGELDPEQRRQAELIVESGRAMMLLLNDILDLSKIEAGEVAIDHAPVDLYATLLDCVALHRPSAEEKGLELALHCSHRCQSEGPLEANAGPWIMSDALRLRQIALNLIGNAVKFTQTGQIDVSYTVEHRIVRLQVRDSGIGIEKARLESIFRPFTQGEGDTARRFGGTGLGLSISRQLAHLLGGRIEVESTAGRGSCFTLVLPAPPAEPERRPPPAPARIDPGDLPQSARVLVAEDHDLNRQLVTEMLERCGQTVALAHDGNEAISMVIDSMVRGRPFDMVLMDVQMPDCDGYAATRAIRAEGIGPDDLPIIALTANAFPEDVANSRRAGMQAHLAKPLEFAALARMLQRWLPTRIVEAAPSALDEPPARGSAKDRLERSCSLSVPREDWRSGGTPSSSVRQRWLARRSEAVKAVREALEEGWLRAEEAGRSDEGASLCRQLHRLAATAAMFGEAQLGDKAAALGGALAMDHAAAPKESLARELLAAADEGGASQERAAGSTGE